MWPIIKLFCCQERKKIEIGGNSFLADGPSARGDVVHFAFLCLSHTSLHDFHAISLSPTIFTMRMICGCVVMLRTDLFKKKKREWKGNTEFNVKGPIDFNGESNYAAATALPHPHITPAHIV